MLSHCVNKMLTLRLSSQSVAFDRFYSVHRYQQLACNVASVSTVCPSLVIMLGQWITLVKILVRTQPGSSTSPAVSSQDAKPRRPACGYDLMGNGCDDGENSESSLERAVPLSAGAFVSSIWCLKASLQRQLQQHPGIKIYSVLDHDEPRIRNRSGIGIEIRPVSQ